jgi:hypothetical protein
MAMSRMICGDEKLTLQLQFEPVTLGIEGKDILACETMLYCTISLLHNGSSSVQL